MSDGLKEGLEIALFVFIAALLVAAAAWVTHEIDAKKLASVQKTYATQESERNKKLLQDYADAVTQRDRGQASANAAAVTAANTIKAQNEQLSKLNACIASGACGLRIHTIAAQCNSASVPASASDGDAGYARLAPDAQQAYSALRAGISAVQQQLSACKAYASSVMAVAAPN